MEFIVEFFSILGFVWALFSIVAALFATMLLFKVFFIIAVVCIGISLITGLVKLLMRG